MARLSGQGAMALLELDAAAAEALIADHPQVTVAVYASPRQTVIAGPPDAVDTPHRGRWLPRTGWPVASTSTSLPTTPSSTRYCRNYVRRWPDSAPATPTIPVISTAVELNGATTTFDARLLGGQSA